MKNSGVGEMMAQWIRVLVDLLENLGYIPSTEVAVSNPSMLPRFQWIYHPLLPSAITACI